MEGIRPQYKKPITTEVVKLTEFYPAEEYHKDYYDNNRLNPYCTLVIWPKLRKIMKEFGMKGH
jgi:peptide-methionine (S)-S-oxide reductase